VLHSKGQISLSAAVVAPGLTVMAAILFMGAVSGAHLNPVMSIAFALRRDFRWYRIPWYVLAQLVGATLAALSSSLYSETSSTSGPRCPGPATATGRHCCSKSR
jgi:aquaporin Z